MKENVSFASCFVALRVNFIDRTDTRFARAPRYFRAGTRRLDGFQILDEVVLLLLGQFQFGDGIVMVDGRVEARLPGDHFDM